MSEFVFTPCGDQAQRIDLDMRLLLAGSLDHIGKRAEGILEFDPAAMERLSAGLSGGLRFPPSTFALYTELVLAIEADDYGRANWLLAELAQEDPGSDGWEITALGNERAPLIGEAYKRLMNTDPSAEFGIFPPTTDEVNSFKSRLLSGFELLSKALPKLATEFNHLVSQVVLVAGDPRAKYQFDGGSCYMMWGGLFLNVTSHENDVAMVEVLAHESAHMLLFGFARDEPLVMNDDSERFPSPLRADPRPMDGIYHSTYVSARMHWAMSELLTSGLLDGKSREFAERAREADMNNFFSGYGVVEKFGDLTNTGRAVMKSARSYMDSVR